MNDDQKINSRATSPAVCRRRHPRARAHAGAVPGRDSRLRGPSPPRHWPVVSNRASEYNWNRRRSIRGAYSSCHQTAVIRHFQPNDRCDQRQSYFPRDYRLKRMHGSESNDVTRYTVAGKFRSSIRASRRAKLSTRASLSASTRRCIIVETAAVGLWRAIGSAA